MTLALHLSLWHPDDVMLQWDIMQNNKKSIIHLPSLIIGVGMAAGFAALLAISAKKPPLSVACENDKVIYTEVEIVIPEISLKHQL
ncbi:UNVERIFIED_CONTAM: hypothetical protein Sangu_0685600 [Sesamum angustifolium]|uniref:Uncharacterized protein n=1 Tax=Sesamum angustifolium TaxID=2727405 RepID=A0AAW2PT76_9LAMI